MRLPVIRHEPPFPSPSYDLEALCELSDLTLASVEQVIKALSDPGWSPKFINKTFVANLSYPDGSLARVSAVTATIKLKYEIVGDPRTALTGKIWRYATRREAVYAEKRHILMHWEALARGLEREMASPIQQNESLI